MTDRDITTIRNTLDETPIWDACDKATDRMLDKLKAHEMLLIKIRDAWDDLQETYADISLHMEGDEKEVTEVKVKIARLKFSNKASDLISQNYSDIPRTEP